MVRWNSFISYDSIFRNNAPQLIEWQEEAEASLKMNWYESYFNPVKVHLPESRKSSN